jgi:hypothetical protein
MASASGTSHETRASMPFAVSPIRIVPAWIYGSSDASVGVMIVPG